MHRYRELHVWREAYALVLSVYREAANHLADEVASEVRRAALRVSMNLIRGSRASGLEAQRAIGLAEAWLGELELLLLVAGDLGPRTRTPPSICHVAAIAPMLRTLRFIGGDVTRMQSPLAEHAEAAEAYLESILDRGEFSRLPAGLSVPPQESSTTDGGERPKARRASGRPSTRRGKARGARLKGAR